MFIINLYYTYYYTYIYVYYIINKYILMNDDYVIHLSILHGSGRPFTLNSPGNPYLHYGLEHHMFSIRLTIYNHRKIKEGHQTLVHTLTHTYH